MCASITSAIKDGLGTFVQSVSPATKPPFQTRSASEAAEEAIQVSAGESSSSSID